MCIEFSQSTSEFDAGQALKRTMIRHTTITGGIELSLVEEA